MRRFILLFLSTVLLTVHSRAAEPFAFSDDFTKHAPGSDGSPQWSSAGIGWEVQNGAMTCADAGKDQALLAAAPIGARVFLQADVKLTRATGKHWKVAGLCVSKDDKNFWHLALCETPDDSGKKHSVELCEMLGGTWLAQYQAGTKLDQKEAKGNGFAWEYNHAYRLSIELTPDSVTGQVQELDGTVRTKIIFVLPNDQNAATAVTCGRPGLTSGGFQSNFTALSTKISDPIAAQKPTQLAEKFPPYEAGTLSKASHKGKATGFFHVEEIDGKWWTIDPIGNAFFIIGTDHPNYQAHWCEKLGYAPYHRNCEKKYGSEAKWADNTLGRLKSWGFNALGTNPSQSLKRRGLPHPEFLGLGTHFTDQDAITPKTTWTGFPNVFSPRWPVFCDKMAQRHCAPFKDDPWILGYFIDNELEWHAWTGGGPFIDSFKKPADHSAKRALVDLMKSRHATIADFNKAWETKLATFDELAALTTPPPAKTDAARADIAEFTRLVAERYFSIASAAIRKHDPNHMVLGCRFAGQAPEIVDVAGKYCDIFTINCYRNVDLERGVMSDGFEEDLKRWHDQCKRPMMITEWSFPALDAGLPCKHGAGQRVPTQVEKSFCFTVFQKLLFTTPYMVGSNYFMWADEPALGISTVFPEDSNYGLVNENDEPYELLTQAATKLHAVVDDIHSGKVTDVSVKPNDKDGFTVSNNGAIPANVKLTRWIGAQSESEDLTLEPGAAREFAPGPKAELEKPGGHVCGCVVELEKPLLQKSMGGTRATQVVYKPALPWQREEGTNTRVPLVVANPTEYFLSPVMVVMPLSLFSKLGKQLGAWDEEGAARTQVNQFDEGAVLTLITHLDPHSCSTVFVHPYRGEPPIPQQLPLYSETKTGFQIHGRIQCVKTDNQSGNAFDRIWAEGVELGHFRPLVHQVTDKQAWSAPDRVEKVDVVGAYAPLILEITFARTNDKKYRGKYRFTFVGDNWFTSQLLWIENTDTTPWELAEYYHYLPSNIGGSNKDDEARGNYWFDPKTKMCLGIVPGGRDLAVNFWKDPQGGEHPDARRKLNITLQPGQRYTGKDEPVAYIVACKEDQWKETTKKIAAQREVIWKVFEAEKR
ncbi:MAG TPA: beta-galactosidase [Planctomycetota bacterium]|jgi:agarase